VLRSHRSASQADSYGSPEVSGGRDRDDMKVVEGGNGAWRNALVDQLRGSASSPSKVRSRSVATPPWVTAATWPLPPDSATRNARSRSPADREDSPLPSTRSRSRVERSQPARKASNGWVPSQFKRSRRRLSSWTGRPVARAMGCAVSRARRSGLLYSAQLHPLQPPGRNRGLAPAQFR
jgi:hypothetical protein